MVSKIDSERERLKERFERFVMPIPWSGCHEWIGSVQRYGHFRYPNGQLAHRASWEIYKGEIPSEMHVLHRCDNTSCVNPEHLFLGTHEDNMKDKAKKGRAPGLEGESHPMRKLNEYAIRMIRDSEDTPTQLAKTWGTSRQYVNQIQRGDVWKHLK